MFIYLNEIEIYDAFSTCNIFKNILFNKKIISIIFLN
jgi:hypothetical protein